jgi:exodeoxyribonuclease VII large subunit
MKEPMEALQLPEFTVTEISSQIKMAVEGAFPYVRVRGEISGYKRAPSGHVYLNLKDENSVLASVCWKGVAMRFAFKPEDGLEVLATGSITTYGGQSKYQLVIDNMQPAGAGALMALLEKRKKKFELEGLFDAARKQKIPYLPEVIGVITSPTGAVIRDILHRIEDRFPLQVIVWPTLVQGEQAAGQIAAAINGFNNLEKGGKIARPDVLIVARGGGSVEDLWAFNEEEVVRAAANSTIPLISAIGHETDFTLLDYVADLRAPTPTAAAEMAVPVKSELILFLDELSKRNLRGIYRVVEMYENTLKSLLRAIPNPKKFIEEKAQRLDNNLIRMENAICNFLREKQQNIDLPGRLLESYHYKRVLERGFALVRGEDGKVIKSIKSLKPANNINIELGDGSVDLNVIPRIFPQGKL